MIEIIILIGVITVSLMLITRKISSLPIDRNKLTVYECGNIPNEESPGRGEFKVKYYRVGLIYLIFDLETLWLFPIFSTEINSFMYITILLFIFILILGVVYEYMHGLLNNI